MIFKTHIYTMMQTYEYTKLKIILINDNNNDENNNKLTIIKNLFYCILYAVL